jgi:hypothetical protein
MTPQRIATSALQVVIWAPIIGVLGVYAGRALDRFLTRGEDPGEDW